MNSKIFKSQKYEEILFKCLKINEDNIKLDDNSDIAEILYESFQVYGDIDYYIFLKSEFIYSIDDVFICIFDNKYIVTLDSDLEFMFVGDTESNWLEEAFGWGFHFSDIFMQECFKEFGTPIKKFDKSFLTDEYLDSLKFSENKINSSIIKSPDYKKILCDILKLKENKINFPNNIDLKKSFKKAILLDSDTYSYQEYIYSKTEFVFFIHNYYIGIFDNKYIVALNKNDLKFKFVGDSESNWLQRAFNSYDLDFNKFMNLCLQNFGVQIKKYGIPFDF